jgi:hypothetical protein
MTSKFKTVAVWLPSVLLLVAFAWSLNLTLFNWWASGGPPVQHPEIYRHRGNVFCGISFVLFLNFIVAAWVLARRRKRGLLLDGKRESYGYYLNPLTKPIR